MSHACRDQSVDVTDAFTKTFSTFNATSSKWHHLNNDPELNVQISAMTILVARVGNTRWSPQKVRLCARSIGMTSKHHSRAFTCSRCGRMAGKEKKPDGDPRINVLERAITDEFATIRETYGAKMTIHFSL